MSDLPLTTIIPWCQRRELEQTLRHNAPIFAAMRSDVIVVNCGGDSGMLRDILSEGAVDATQVDVPASFNRSLAINIGIRWAVPGMLFVVDTDILLTASLRRYAEICARDHCFGILGGMTTVPPGKPTFTPPSGSFLRKIVTEMRESYHWSDGRVTEAILGRTDRTNDRRSACGVILVRRQDMLDVGGYRSDFEGWGWEDIDVQVRLLRQGLRSMLVHEEIRHIEHGDSVRDLKAGKGAQSAAANRSRAWRSYCDGQLRGTYEADLERSPTTVTRVTSARGPRPMAV